jgi:hypothetical protein
MVDFFIQIQIQLEFLKSCYLLDKEYGDVTGQYDIIENDIKFLDIIELQENLVKYNNDNKLALSEILKLCKSLLWIQINDLEKLKLRPLPEFKKTVYHDLYPEFKEPDNKLISLYSNVIYEENHDVYSVEINSKMNSFSFRCLKQHFTAIIHCIEVFDPELKISLSTKEIYTDVFSLKFPHFSPWPQDKIVGLITTNLKNEILIDSSFVNYKNKEFFPLKKYWFQVGLNFANGKIDEFLNNGIDSAPQIAKELGDSRFQKYILASLKNYNTSETFQKNIFNKGHEKAKQILRYCEMNNIKVVDTFHSRVKMGCFYKSSQYF